MSNEERRVGMWGESLGDHVELELEPREPRAAAVGDQATAPGEAVCAGCKRSLDRARMELSGGQLMCKTCINNRRATYVPSASASVASSAGGLTLGVIGGAVGALLGAAIWAAVAIMTEREIGYVAVLVGFLAGAGVRWGADRGSSQRLLAGLLAIAGMIVAKYIVFAYVVIQFAHKSGVEIGAFNTALLSNFPKALVETASPFDALFAFLAIAAAARTCKPT